MSVKITKPVEIDGYIKRLTFMNKLFKKNSNYYLINDNILIDDNHVIIMFPEKLCKNSNDRLVFIKSLFGDTVKFTGIKTIYKIDRDKLHEFIKSSKNNISEIRTTDNSMIIYTQNSNNAFVSPIINYTINEKLLNKLLYIYQNFNNVVNTLIEIPDDDLKTIFSYGYFFGTISEYKVTLNKSMFPINSFKNDKHHIYLYIKKETEDLLNNQIVLLNNDKYNYISMTEYIFVNF